MGTTSDDLLTDVRRTGFLPDTMDFSSTDLLAFADAELQTLVAMTIAMGREEQWTTTYDVAITPGKVSYTLPRRALGRAIRAVFIVLEDDTNIELTPVTAPELRQLYYGQTSPVIPRWYAFEADSIRLGAVPASGSYTLRVMYVRQPSRLILAASGVAVVAPATSTTITTAGGSLPATLTTAGAYLDIVSGAEPHDVVAQDIQAVSYSDPTLTVSTYTTSAVASAATNRERDYVCPAEQTVYPPVPGVLWPSLVRGTARAVLDALGDPRAGRMQDLADEARQAARNMMEPRDQTRSKTIRGSSPLRSRGFFRRGWW